MKKSESGITLIALVVTIVVLLILAATTIVYVMSDTGIVKQTQTATSNYISAAIKEYAEQIQVDAAAKYYGTGEELTLSAKDAVQAYFPGTDLYTVGETVTDLKSTKGKMGGSFEVTSKARKLTYTVSFSSGVCTVTEKTASE